MREVLVAVSFIDRWSSGQKAPAYAKLGCNCSQFVACPGLRLCFWRPFLVTWPCSSSRSVVDESFAVLRNLDRFGRSFSVFFLESIRSQGWTRLDSIYCLFCCIFCDSYSLYIRVYLRQRSSPWLVFSVSIIFLYFFSFTALFWSVNYSSYNCIALFDRLWLHRVSENFSHSIHQQCLLSVWSCVDWVSRAYRPFLCCCCCCFSTLFFCSICGPSPGLKLNWKNPRPSWFTLQPRKWVEEEISF